MLLSRCWPVLTGDVADLHAVAAQTNQVTVIEIQGSWAGAVLILTLPARLARPRVLSWHGALVATKAPCS
jgi:hypothetical protein